MESDLLFMNLLLQDKYDASKYVAAYNFFYHCEKTRNTSYFSLSKKFTIIEVFFTSLNAFKK